MVRVLKTIQLKCEISFTKAEAWGKRTLPAGLPGSWVANGTLSVLWSKTLSLPYKHKKYC